MEHAQVVVPESPGVADLVEDKGVLDAVLSPARVGDDDPAPGPAVAVVEGPIDLDRLVREADAPFLQAALIS